MLGRDRNILPSQLNTPLLIRLLPIPRPVNKEPQSVTDVPPLDKTIPAFAVSLHLPRQCLGLSLLRQSLHANSLKAGFGVPAK